MWLPKLQLTCNFRYKLPVGVLESFGKAEMLQMSIPPKLDLKLIKICQATRGQLLVLGHRVLHYSIPRTTTTYHAVAAGR